MFIDINVPGEFATAENTPIALYASLVLASEPVQEAFPHLFNEDGDMHPSNIAMLEEFILFGVRHVTCGERRVSMRAWSNDGENITVDVRISLEDPISNEEAVSKAERIVLAMAVVTRLGFRDNVFASVSQLTWKMERYA